ncbi:hypothetical protein [Klebsiella pneumoniae]|uniref:hypothetical protein n=1 Tax=Klebsiella pneumoniae TaxID=573 RepID=UPI00248B7412|nr:hypothetical protein [Klebsiella pneumoniae]MDI2051542.1 hypothetical protein [Klebsiella pneumoniae]
MMKSKTITEAELINIFESYGAYICPDEIEYTLKECNENGSVFHRGFNAEGWAHLFAKEEAYQQQCEAQEAASEDVHFD